jgi:DNA polymerase
VRGNILPAPGAPVLVTFHPAYLLRLPDPARKADAQAAFRSDLSRVAQFLAA